MPVLKIPRRIFKKSNPPSSMAMRLRRSLARQLTSKTKVTTPPRKQNVFGAVGSPTSLQAALSTDV